MSTLVLAAVLAINLFVLLMYGWDKRKAVKKAWRTPESTLLAGGLIAPFGAVLGMHIFRHKTRKPVFKLNYVFLAAHILLIAYFFVL